MAENALTRRRFMAVSTAALSGVESAAAELKGLASDADWVGAHRFAEGAPESEIVDWADSLNLR